MIIRTSFPRMIMCAIVCVGQTAMAQVIFTNDFEDSNFGAYTSSSFGADWNGDSINSSQGIEEGRATVVNEGTKALRVEYPAGLFGSGDDKTGAQFKMEFGQGYEAVELEYRLKFEDGFDFVRGGKLPGLAGGAANSGGNRPDGTDGFSARMMWRTNGSSGSPTSSSQNGSDNRANIVQYIYHPDQTTNDGRNADDFDWDDGPSGDWEEFETDQWYHFRHRIIMNTPGANGGEGLHDGVAQAWLNGVQVLDVDDIRYRDVASLQIDQLYFSTFFGGGSDPWKTSKDEFAYFDDFKVTALGQLGDFDFDGAVVLADLDQFIGSLGAAVGQNSELAALDLDGNGIVEAADFEQHYSTLVQTSNGQTGTVAGDADLNGIVDVLGDAAILVNNLNSVTSSWSQGDFNGDGTVDVLNDAAALVNNLGVSNALATPATTAVPEPSSVLLTLFASGGFFAARRKR